MASGRCRVSTDYMYGTVFNFEQLLGGYSKTSSKPPSKCCVAILNGVFVFSIFCFTTSSNLFCRCRICTFHNTAVDAEYAHAARSKELHDCGTCSMSGVYGTSCRSFERFCGNFERFCRIRATTSDVRRPRSGSAQKPVRRPRSGSTHERRPTSAKRKQTQQRPFPEQNPLQLSRPCLGSSFLSPRGFSDKSVSNSINLSSTNSKYSRPYFGGPRVFNDDFFL